MDIGITARVEPELDERQAEREQGRLSEMLDESASGLEPEANFDAILDRMNEVEERAREAMQPIAQPGAETGIRSQMTAPVSGGGSDGAESGVTDAESPSRNALSMSKEIASNTADTALQVKSVQGGLNKLGNQFKAKGGKVALVGTGLLFLSRLYESFKGASPALQSVSDMFSQAISLFFRPFGNVLAKYLLPIARGVLQFAAEFNRVFESEGIKSAMAFAVRAGLAGLKDATVSALTSKTFLQLGALYGVIRGALTKGLTKLLTRLGLSSGLAAKLVPGPALKSALVSVLKRFGLKGLGRIVGYFIPVVNIVLTLDLILELLTGWSPIFDSLLPALVSLTRGFFEASFALLLLTVGFLSAIPDLLGDIYGWFQNKLGALKTLASLDKDQIISGLISGPATVTVGKLVDGVPGPGDIVDTLFPTAIPMEKFLKAVTPNKAGINESIENMFSDGSDGDGGGGGGDLTTEGEASVMAQSVTPQMPGNVRIPGMDGFNEFGPDGERVGRSGGVDATQPLAPSHHSVSGRGGSTAGAESFGDTSFDLGAIAKETAKGGLTGGLFGPKGAVVGGAVLGLRQTAKESADAGITPELLDGSDDDEDSGGSIAPIPITPAPLGGLFASGGVVTGPTSAIIGEGGESEAVVPFSRVDEFVQSAITSEAFTGARQATRPEMNVSLGGADGIGTDTAGGDGRGEMVDRLDDVQSVLMDIARLLRQSDGEGTELTINGRVLAEEAKRADEQFERSRYPID